MIGTPRPLRLGYYDGMWGRFWAWPIDGYYDLHHAPDGSVPDGDDVIEEGLSTLRDARTAARRWHDYDERTLTARLIGARR